jgi:hypothetical protein
MKKLHFFLFRRSDTKQNAVCNKEQPQSRDDDSTNQSVLSVLEKPNNRWFLLRIIRHGRFMNRKKDSATPIGSTNSQVSSNPTTRTSRTKNATNSIGGISPEGTPVSFINIDPKSMDETSRRDLLQKLTSTKIMEKHGLDREDSIISYFKQVDDAYNEMVIVVEQSQAQSSDTNADDNDYNDEFYNEQNTIEQSISLITMDPALVYRHSITNMDEYSWKSFQSLSENDDEYEPDDDDDDDHEPVVQVAPIRYCQI